MELPSLLGPSQTGFRGTILGLNEVQPFIAKKGVDSYIAGQEIQDGQVKPFIVDSLKSPIKPHNLEYKMTYKIDRIIILDGEFHL